jgi:hypothetical protein
MRKQGFFLNINEAETYYLRQLAADRNMTMTNLLRLCIQLLWVEREIELEIKTGKPGQLFLEGENYTINILELAQFGEELAQISQKVDWTKVFQKQKKTPLKRLKKPLKQAI